MAAPAIFLHKDFIMSVFCNNSVCYFVIFCSYSDNSVTFESHNDNT